MANASVDHLMRRNALLLIVLASCQCAAYGGQLYRCTLVDGSERDVAQDLAIYFADAVRNCKRLPERTTAVTWSAEEPGLTIMRKPEGSAATGARDDRQHGLTLTMRNSASLAKGDLALLIEDASRRHDLDPELIDAIIGVESSHRPDARSPKGALGLMQVMPATAARYGVRAPNDLLHPAVNIEAGARYLADLQRMYPGRIDLVLAAYNAGEGAVARHGNRVPPYRETVDYVQKILTRYAIRTSGRWSME